jgi:hypothetical protein
VPIVANGRADPEETGHLPSPECRLAAIEFLQEVLARGCVVLDLAGEVEAEYHRHLNPRGQPGVGDRFYLEVLNSAPGRIERVDLTKDEDGQYQDFPRVPELTGFDPNDRKFAALARRERIPVANATDSDWLIYRAALKANGISVRFVCGIDGLAWFTVPTRTSSAPCQRESSKASH